MNNQDKWTLCIPSNSGTQRYACHNYEQADIMLREWLSAGWVAYLQAPNGHKVNQVADFKWTFTKDLN